MLYLLLCENDVWYVRLLVNVPKRKEVKMKRFSCAMVTLEMRQLASCITLRHVVLDWHCDVKMERMETVFLRVRLIIWKYLPILLVLRKMLNVSHLNIRHHFNPKMTVNCYARSISWIILILTSPFAIFI